MTDRRKQKITKTEARRKKIFGQDRIPPSENPIIGAGKWWDSGGVMGFGGETYRPASLRLKTSEQKSTIESQNPAIFFRQISNHGISAAQKVPEIGGFFRKSLNP